MQVQYIHFIKPSPSACTFTHVSTVCIFSFHKIKFIHLLFGLKTNQGTCNNLTLIVWNRQKWRQWGISQQPRLSDRLELVLGRSLKRKVLYCNNRFNQHAEMLLNLNTAFQQLSLTNWFEHGKLEICEDEKVIFQSVSPCSLCCIISSFLQNEHCLFSFC